MPILTNTLEYLSNLKDGYDITTADSIAETSKIAGAWAVGFLVSRAIAPLPKTALDKLFYSLTGKTVPYDNRRVLTAFIVSELVQEGIDKFNESGKGADFIEENAELIGKIKDGIEKFISDENNGGQSKISITLDGRVLTMLL